MFKKILIFVFFITPLTLFAEGDGNLNTGAGDAPIVFPPDEKGKSGRPETMQFMKDVVSGEIKQTFELDEKGQKKGNYLLMEEKAAKALSQTQGALKETPTPAPTHIYEMGAPSAAIMENHEYDSRTTLHDETFEDCVEYKMIDVWEKQIGPDPEDVLIMPYVKYYGPVQKVENVDNPLKSGYFSKDEMKSVRDRLEGDEYYKFAAQLADYEIAYLTYVQAYQAYRLGGQFGLSQSGYESPEGSNIKPSLLDEKGGPGQHYERVSPSRAVKDGQGYKWPGDTAIREEMTSKAVRDVQTMPVELRYKNMDASGQTSGYVYNEYHLLPTDFRMKYDESSAKAYEKSPDVLIADLMSQRNMKVCEDNGQAIVAGFHPAFPHNVKNPMIYMSDFPEQIIISRFAPASIYFFPLEMFFRALYPEICQYFNVNSDYNSKSISGMKIPNQGRKLNMDRDDDIATDDQDIPGNDAFWGAPSDLLTGFIDPKNTGISYQEVCQGFNQASWLPVLNTVQTAFHTVAAAVGTVKAAKIGHKYYPGNNYDFVYDNEDYNKASPFVSETELKRDGDKVQWLRSKYMDGPPNSGEEESPKKCRSVERWVLKYGQGNMKLKNDPSQPDYRNQDKPEDHWHVVNHWHYWRGLLDPCPQAPGIWLNPPPGHPIFGTEGRKDNECISYYGVCK